MQNWAVVRKKSALLGRARIIRSIRDFFVEGGYLEVETPLRIPAPAPESHIDAIGTDGWYLHTSPEICMKRLLAAGYERLFQICHCWRDSERGTRHLPEFTMLEWYSAGSSYLDLMNDCELLLRAVVRECSQGNSIAVGKRIVLLSGHWERLTVRDAFLRYGGLSMEEALSRDVFDDVMVERIEPQLGWDTPTFLCDYPAERGALARLKEGDPAVAERFELYIGGIELANGFSELNDAEEQRRRFESEMQIRTTRGRANYPLPAKFLNELPRMPPSAGIALGIDRLVMVLLGAQAIDDIVAFTPEEL